MLNSNFYKLLSIIFVEMRFSQLLIKVIVTGSITISLIFLYFKALVKIVFCKDLKKKKTFRVKYFTYLLFKEKNE